MRPLEFATPVRRPLPLTPLIDVVFLLLLFFMLASVFQKEGEIEIAAAGSNASAPSTTRPVLVRVHADGRIDVNGESVSADDLGRAVATITQNSDLLAGAVLQIREGTAVQRVVEALTSLQSSRVRPVALAH